MDLSFKKSCILGFLILVHVLFVVARNDPFQGEGGFSKDNATNTRTRLLVSVPEDYDTDFDWRSKLACSKDDIYINQGQTDPLPSGIPTYTVEIENLCLDADNKCIISDIHLACGWFSSARLINPYVFRRLSFDDCLVNNGNPMTAGQTISFFYANTYPYPLSVSSATCSQE